MWCWGQNNNGELGIGVVGSEHGPVQVEGVGPSAEVAAGGYHACARSSVDGTVWCWGRNGELEAGAATSSEMCGSAVICTRPHPVAGTEGSKRVVVGHRHGCIIDSDDRVACWGRNSSSQLGEGPRTPRSTPLRIATLAAVSDLSAAGRFMCAVEMSGRLLCWGDGEDGELGAGDFSSSDAPRAAHTDDVQTVAVGAFGGCATHTDGTVSCWGMHDTGEGLSLTTNEPRTSLVEGATALASHYLHSCAIIGTDVSCWGADDFGQLGRGTQATKSVPADVGINAALLAVGSNHVCVLSTGALKCWGDNDHAQAGGAELKRYYVPTLVDVGAISVAKLVATDNRTCVMASGGAVKCWGAAKNGSLGSGLDVRHQATPTAILTTGVVDIALGSEHLCVLTSTPNVICYGSNAKGQLGTSMTTTESLTGITVAVSSISKVIAGGRHSCVLDTSGAVSCWGSDESGQLGDGKTITRATPMAVAGIGTVLEVGAGTAFTCARNNTDQIYCWGRGNNGQIGVGDRVDHATPVKVVLPAATTASALFVGAAGACARLNTGAVVCWGDSDYGQNANSSTSDALVPTFVPALANATKIAISSGGVCGIVANAVRCAGRDRLLANGDMSGSVPTPAMLPACDAP